MMLTELLPKSTVPMEILPMGKVTFLLSRSILAKLLDDFLNSDEESEDFHEALQMKSP
jgi:hypothetical protein